MVLIVKIIGMLMMAAGIVILLRPSNVRKVLSYFEEGNRIYVVAVVRILIGVLLLVSARACRLPWVTAVIGILPLVAGISIFVMGDENSRALIRCWKEKPESLFRRLSLVPIILGALLVLAA